MAWSTYDIQIAGHLPENALEELGEVELIRHELRTSLTCQFEDQAAMFGFLARLRALSLELVEIRGVPPAARTAQGFEHDNAG